MLVERLVTAVLVQFLPELPQHLVVVAQQLQAVQLLQTAFLGGQAAALHLAVLLERGLPDKALRVVLAVQHQPLMAVVAVAVQVPLAVTVLGQAAALGALGLQILFLALL